MSLDTLKRSNSLDKLLNAVKLYKHDLIGIEGQEDSEWILVDCGDVIVNIMQQDAREFYDLEKMWSEPLSKKRINI